MAKSIEITVSARDYEGCDDCLAAAAEDVAAERGLEGYDLAPRWADEDRSGIVLTIPLRAARNEVRDLTQRVRDEAGVLPGEDQYLDVYTIVDQALADAPGLVVSDLDAMVDDIAEIVREAREDAAAERAAEATA